MKIIVNNEKLGTSSEIETSVKTVKELLEEISVNFETVIVARNSEILLLNDTICDGDSIILLSVISGG